MLDVLPALKKPTISTLSDPEWVAVNTIIEEAVVRQILPKLKAAKRARDRRISPEQDRAVMTANPQSDPCGRNASCCSARQRRDVEAERVAARIVRDVQRRGDAALLRLDEETRRRDLRRERVWISRSEIHTDSVRERRIPSRRETRRPQRPPRRRKARCRDPGRSTSSAACASANPCSPIETIGCYIPGGRHALVSTLVMTATPAMIAGVESRRRSAPTPMRNSSPQPAFSGVTEIARIGGAQAIAALAYGTRSIPRVEKIFGPGNRFVTAAKQLVSGDCAIDLPAGPTEAIVLAIPRQSHLDCRRSARPKPNTRLTQAVSS